MTPNQIQRELDAIDEHLALVDTQGSRLQVMQHAVQRIGEAVKLLLADAKARKEASSSDN